VRAIAVGPRVAKMRQPESELINLTIEALDASFRETENAMWEREGPLEVLLKGAKEYMAIYTECSNPTIMTISDKAGAGGRHSRSMDISFRSFLSEEQDSKRLAEGETDISVTVGSYPKLATAQVKIEPTSGGIYYPDVYVYVEMHPFLA